jgi:AcrR family transcriptional regulator
MGITERRERERAERQRAILDTARELFFERGYDAVTMSQIAAAAELGKGTLYSYFDAKESIYIALMREGVAILRCMIDEAPATRPPRPAICSARWAWRSSPSTPITPSTSG